jgi:hypothetical protein
MNESNLKELDIKLSVSDLPIESPSSVTAMNEQSVSVSAFDSTQHDGLKQTGILENVTREDKNEEGEEEDAFSELVAPQNQSFHVDKDVRVFPDLLEELRSKMILQLASDLKKLAVEKAAAIDDDKLEEALGIKKTIDKVKLRLTSLEKIGSKSYQVFLTSPCADEIMKVELAIRTQCPSLNSQIVAASAQSTALLFSWACTGGGCCRYNGTEDRPAKLPTFMSNAEKAVKASKNWTSSVRSLLEQLIKNASSSSPPSQRRDAIAKALSASAPTATALSNLASVIRACSSIAATFFTARTLHRSCGQEAGNTALPLLSFETQLLELERESGALASSFPTLGLLSLDSSGKVQPVTLPSTNHSSVSNAAYELFVANGSLVDAVQNKSNLALLPDSQLVNVIVERTNALDTLFSPNASKASPGSEETAFALFKSRDLTYFEDLNVECTLCGRRHSEGKHDDCSSLMGRIK